MNTLNFTNLKSGDKFRILNEGWSKETFIYNDSLMSEKTRRADRLVFPRVGGGNINIPGAVQWKLKLEKVEE
jgi:hypothetical protein